MSRYILCALVFFAASRLSGCGPAEDLPRNAGQVSPRTPLATPVILISCDTLRADHVGVYGYQRATTPNLDAFARDAVQFTNAFTHEVWTLTAHMSMLTGLSPERHGVTPNLNLPRGIPTLAERLANAGYETGGFVGHEYWLEGSRGYARGFGVYSTPTAYRPVAETYALAIDDWLDKHSHGPFFLFLHNYDIHSKSEVTPDNEKGLPYNAEDDAARIFTKGIVSPSFRRAQFADLVGTTFLAGHNSGVFKITREEQDYIERSYDESVVKVDASLGKLFDHLKNTSYSVDDSLYSAALIIVTSDHGESLGSHGKHIHGNVYDENMQVPLLIKLPGQAYAGEVRDAMVAHSDFVPTILSILGLENFEESDGINLMPILAGEDLEDRLIFSRRGYWRAVRTLRYKWVHEFKTGFQALFDLEQDPGELIDIQHEVPAIAESLAQQLTSYYFPPQMGWQVHIRAPKEGMTGTFTVVSEGTILFARMTQGHFVEIDIGPGANNNTVGGELTFTDALPQDTLAIRTEPAGAPIVLKIQMSAPIRNGLKPDAPPQKSWEIAVRADIIALEGDTPQLDGDDVASVTIGYRSPQPVGQAAEPLSEEAIEALKALGYVDL